MSVHADTSDVEGQRLDKWLWVARFFKTRGLAAEAIAAGKVQVDGKRVKPAKTVRPGSTIKVRRDDWIWEVTLRALSIRRRSATEASALYEETEQSQRQRGQHIEERGATTVERRRGAGRPTKRDRRRLARVRNR